MEDNNKINSVEKIKAAAITLVGAGIFSQGTFYFKEQASYNIPRILYPVFKLLGNVGLAVTMLILGLALVYWGFSKWKNHAGKAGIFTLIAIACFAVFFLILFLTTPKKVSTVDLIKASDERHAKEMEKINSAEQPDFGKPEIDAHFATFEKLLKEYSTAFKNKNQQEITSKESAYMSWNEKSAGLIQMLETPEQKQQFALYLTKLSMKWQGMK